MPIFKDVFISYGRKESLHFAKRLFDSLEEAGFPTWFDHVNIPKGDDFQQRIDNGIESAHNFVYIIAPHANNSPYCKKEIELALKLKKRIIPILHIEKDLQEIHPEIGKINWIYGREKEESTKSIDQWKPIDSFESVVNSLTEIIETESSYVQNHTKILHEALQWDRKQRSSSHLLVGKERQQATEWLLAEFTPPKQPPCKPTDLHCEFISESRKNAENLMTDCFICYDAADKQIRDSVTRSLSRYAITCWLHDKDVQKGRSFERAIEEGIEQADNFLFFISSNSLQSDYCKQELAHAVKWNKRIIPILVEGFGNTDDFPTAISNLQYIDFTDNVQVGDFDRDIDEIVNIIRQDREYYNQHKVLLSMSIRWKQNPQTSFLLRGFNLENAETWLRLNVNREFHPPTSTHKEFIENSFAVKGQLSTEVFISYSRTDSDFARELNTKLQETGKTTWFDQESIATGADFQKEIYKGIAASDNFLFIISPEAIESPFCLDEVQYAANLNKRFITILWRDTLADELPKQLAAIQWLDFKNNPFGKSFNELIQTLEIDREYAHSHTLWQQRAAEWQSQQKSKDFLLNATACHNAENWLKEAYDINNIDNIDKLLGEKAVKQPFPTPLQIEYIYHSSKEVAATAERERMIQVQLKQRLRRGTVALSAAVVLLIVSIYFIVLANKNAAEARESSDKVLATNLAFQSKKILERDPNQALNMAAKAFKKADDPSPVILQAVSEAYYTPFSVRHPFYKWQLAEENKVKYFSYNETDSTLAVVVLSEREQDPDSILVYSRSELVNNPWLLEQSFPIPQQTASQFLPSKKTLLITKPKPYAIHYDRPDSIKVVALADTTSILEYELFNNSQNIMTYSQEGDIQLFDLLTGKKTEVRKKIRRGKSEDKSFKNLQLLNIEQKKLREREQELLNTLQKIGIELKQQNNALIDSFPEQNQKRMVQQQIIQHPLTEEKKELSQGLLKERKAKIQGELTSVRKQLDEIIREAQGVGREVFSDRNTLFEAYISEEGTKILTRYNKFGSLINATNGKEIDRINDNLISLKFNQKTDKFLAVNFRGRATVYNLNALSRNENKRLRGDNASSQNLFIPKSNLLMSFFTDGQGFFWDTQTEQITKRFALPTNTNFSKTPIPSPNGKAVAINSGREVWIVESTGKAKPYRLRALDNTIKDIQFSASGNILAVSYQEFTVVYQFLNNRYERAVYLPYAIQNISFTSDDKAIIGNLEDIRKDLIRLWPISFQVTEDFKSLSCDGFNLTGSKGYRIQKDTLVVIPKNSGLDNQYLVHNDSLQPWIYPLQKDDMLITATSNGDLYVWDSLGNKLNSIAANFNKEKTQITIAFDLNYIALQNEGVTKIWKLLKNKEEQVATVENLMQNIVLARNGSLLVGIEEGKLVGKDFIKNNVVFTTPDSLSKIERFIIHPSEAVIGTIHTDESIIRLWSKPLEDRVREDFKRLSNTEIINEFKNSLKPISSGSSRETFELEMIREIELPFYKVVTCKFSDSGKYIAIAGQSETLVGEIMGSKKWRNILPNQFSSAFSERIEISFSQNDKYLLVSEVGEEWKNIGFELLFWDLNSSQLIFRQRLAKQRNADSRIRFFTDGGSIGVGSYILPTPKGIVEWLEKQPFADLTSKDTK